MFQNCRQRKLITKIMEVPLDDNKKSQIMEVSVNVEILGVTFDGPRGTLVPMPVR